MVASWFRVNLLGMSGILKVEIIDENLVHVTCSDGDIFTNNLHRASRYWKGVIFRQTAILDRYSLPGLVEIRPGDHVIDVGANVGEFSIAAGAICGRVTAFEPDRDLHPALSRNTHRMVAACHLSDGLLYHDVRTVQFVCDSHDANSSIFAPLDAGNRSELRETTTLDLALSSVSLSATFI